MATREHLFLLIIFVVFGLTFIVQSFYYVYFYLALMKKRPAGTPHKKEPVSVIICARNEEENLRVFLPSVLKQDYPNFEVIVVNDCSEDNTFEVLGSLIPEYPHLKVSTVQKDPKFTHNKKFAQFIGIKAATNEYLLFTDADCQPVSPDWIGGMVSHFTENTDFVLGYGGFFREKGLFNRYIRYDSMTIAMQYLGMAIRGLPYMGVGRNLAYKKSVFFRNRGFSSHNYVISGDDDLFVNANATGSNTAVEYNHPSHTRSVPASGFRQWFRQKRRHLTTAKYYKPRHKILLMAEPASRIIFYLSFAVLLSRLFLWQTVAALFLLRMIIQITVLAITSRRLNEKGLIAISLIFDIFSPLLNGSVYLANILNKSGQDKWK